MEDYFSHCYILTIHPMGHNPKSSEFYKGLYSNLTQSSFFCSDFVLFCFVFQTLDNTLSLKVIRKCFLTEL